MEQDEKIKPIGEYAERFEKLLKQIKWEKCKCGKEVAKLANGELCYDCWSEKQRTEMAEWQKTHQVEPKRKRRQIKMQEVKVK